MKPEDLIPKCPECGASADRLKCAFELNPEFCPRHALMTIFNNGRKYEKLINQPQENRDH